MSAVQTSTVTQTPPPDPTLVVLEETCERQAEEITRLISENRELTSTIAQLRQDKQHLEIETAELRKHLAEIEPLLSEYMAGAPF
jgi:hypothetical protein